MMKTILFILASVIMTFLITRGRNYPSTFTLADISNELSMSRKDDFSGATLVNLDEDPEQEIFIAGHGTSNLFLKRIQDQFRSIDIPELNDPNGRTFSVTACDLDQDGRDEILILNRPDSTPSRIMKYMNGKWTDILSAADPLKEKLKLGYSSTCIDRKGDGKYGLAVTNENGIMLYLEMLNSKVTDIASDIGIAMKSKGRSVLGVPGPDGHTNIFVGNEDGANFYFKNKGDGTFIEQAEAVGLSDPHFNARGMSLIDLNGDDVPDVVYGNNLGPVRLLEQSRDGKFIEVTPEIMKDAYAINSPVVGDFNLDGYEEVYLNNIRGNNKMFSRFDKNWFELDIGVMAEKELQGISTIAADLDHNGSYEILNTHGDGMKSPLTLYSIKPVGQWIKFSVKYKNGVIPRGAIVVLKTTKRDQIRVLSSGSGRFANYDTDVLFGLLKDESVLSAEVTLPSGVKFEFREKFNLLSKNEIRI